MTDVPMTDHVPAPRRRLRTVAAWPSAATSLVMVALSGALLINGDGFSLIAIAFIVVPTGLVAAAWPWIVAAIGRRFRVGRVRVVAWVLPAAYIAWAGLQIARGVAVLVLDRA